MAGAAIRRGLPRTLQFDADGLRVECAPGGVDDRLDLGESGKERRVRHALDLADRVREDRSIAPRPSTWRRPSSTVGFTMRDDIPSAGGKPPPLGAIMWR